VSEQGKAFVRPVKKKGFTEERGTTMRLDAIGTSTTLESNKSHLGLPLPWQSRRPLVYKKSFFVIAPFSHHTPRSNFIEERQAMRYI